MTDLLDIRRWLWFHDQDSRRNKAGLPDIIAVRGPRLLFVELKTETGRLSRAQTEWLAALNLTRAEVHIWRPSDFPTVMEVLA